MSNPAKPRSVNMKPNSAGLPRMIRWPELRLIVPLADSTIYEMEQRGEFPRRFSLTPRCLVWDLADSPFWKSWRGQASAVRVDEAVEQEADHRHGDHRLGDLGQRLVILGQATPSSEPSECSLNHPAARLHDEAGAARGAADDDQRQAEQEAGQQDGEAARRL